MNRYGIPKKDSVELKDNVNNSSSGGGSSSGEYYLFDEDLIGTYFPEIGSNFTILYSFCSSIKTTIKVQGEGENRFIITSAAVIDYSTITNNINTIALKYDKSYDNVFYNTFKELLEQVGLDVTNFDKALPRITEEEFYDLNKWSLEDYK